MKIGIVGDLHIAPEPENRIDNYFQVGLNKIEEISQICDNVIFTGDIFSKPKVDEIYTNTLIEHLRYCMNKYNVEFYTIIGNHDVAHEEEENLNHSSLGTLKVSGVMNVITPYNGSIVLNDGELDYIFDTVPVKFKNLQNYEIKVIQKVKKTLNILLVHHLYESGSECLRYEDLKGSGYDMVFFGHDHKPLDNGRIIYEDLTVYRSGSIMRNIANDYNLERQLYYYILENGTVSCQAITTSDPKSVFKVDAYSRTNYNQKKFTESIDTIIDRYKNNVSTQSKFSIKNIMEELNTPDENMNYIGKKYQQIGEVFI